MRLKHLNILLPLVCAAMAGRAQSNKPIMSQTGPAGTAATLATPAEVSTSGDVSYIRRYVPLIPISDTADVNTGNQPSLIKQQTTYLDGFLRPFQTVTRNAATVSGQARHLVDIAYNYPRGEQRSYLPYAAGSSGLQSNAFQAQRDYYAGLYPNEGYTGFSKTKNTSDGSQYSVTGYAPGKSQVGQDRGTVTQNISNAANEVLIWDWDEGTGMPVSAGYYGAQQLFGRQETAPSDGPSYTVPRSRAYTDKDGRLVLKMEASGYAAAPPPLSYVPVYDYTYYVYDEKGSLRCTITPKAFKYYQDNAGTFSTEVVNNLCFLYQYDDKGRLAAAQKPGEEGFTYLVYDAKERAVMRQTPNERLEAKWEITFYDVLSRVKATSIFKDDATPFSREEWQGELDNAAVNGASPNTILYYIATAAGEAQYPDDGISDNTMMAYTYYDDYRMVDPNGDEWDNLSTQLNFTETIWPAGAEAPERSMNVYGAVTGSLVRILPAPDADPAKTGDWRKSIVFYDSKGRVTYSGSANLNQGNTIHFSLGGTQYDFAGRVLLSKHAWYNANSADGVQGHTELTKYSYDGISGALLNTKHQVDGGNWNTLNAFTYDDLGRVKRKSLGGGGEVQDMGYNIRGQLTGINGTYAETGNKEGYSRSFGESIKYDYGFSENRLDGKMAGMLWRGSNADQMLAYGYEYTRNQLLQTADFNYIKNGSWIKTDMDYSVTGLQYDQNGNITAMNQRGTEPGPGPVDMDKLQYAYEPNSNRLSAVTDIGGVADYGAGDFQDNNTDGADYSYDANGNLTKDANKGISNSIGYTFFNKPVNIALDNGNSFSYSYDATGAKVQELLADQQAGTVVTDYIGNAVYENDSLKYILTADGRTVFEAGAAQKEEFFVKDHLGNVRSTINVTGSMPRVYLAGYEIASANLENLVFDNIDELREYKPGGDAENSMAARLNGSHKNTSVGSALLLHVMAGDKISMKVSDYYDYYSATADTPQSAESMIDNVVTTLVGGYNGFEGENHNTKLVGDIFDAGNSSAYNNLLGLQTDPSRPKAYLNYVVFDEQMKIVPEASGAYQAMHEGGWGEIGTAEAREMPVNGYIAIYLSNATLRDIYFDRLQVQVIKGNLLQENHYYPHGLPITGLSSEDGALAGQRRKYQGNEYIRSGLDWMSFGARQYDPQTGRFLSVDPLAAFAGQDRYSPYAAMGNMPESAVDPNGLVPERSRNNYDGFTSFAMGGGGMEGRDENGFASVSWFNGAGTGGGVWDVLRDFGNVTTLVGEDAQRVFAEMSGQTSIMQGKNANTTDEKAAVISDAVGTDGIGWQVEAKRTFWDKVKHGWKSFTSGVKKWLWRADRTVEGSEIELVTNRQKDTYQGGTMFTGQDGQNKSDRVGGTNADDKSESLNKFLALWGGRGGSGGWGNFSEVYEAYDNFMHAADLMQEAYESPSGAPQKEPKPEKPYIYGKIGESINIDTNGRNIPQEQFKKDLTHLQDSLWGFHN